jgi:thioredoxin 1
MAAFAALQVPAWGQAAAAPVAGGSDFAPLAQWKAAVEAGDKAAMARLYTVTPPAMLKTAAGESSDPSADATYWARIYAKGLSKFDPKLMEIRKLQDGVAMLVLRVEMTSGRNPAADEVLSVSQIWVMQDAWRIAATGRGDPQPAPQSRLAEPAKFNTDLYPAPEAAAAEIASALQTARQEHKRVILMFGGNRCIDCHVLDASFHSKDFAPIVEANYLVVHVSIGDGDKNLDIAKKYDTPLEKGVPALAVLDPDGTVVYSQKQGEFESTIKIGPDDVVQFLQKWKPPTKS